MNSNEDNLRNERKHNGEDYDPYNETNGTIIENDDQKM